MKVQRNSLATQVKDALLDRILKGQYKPGDRLVELAIAKDLGVSQAPVREAFQILEAMRFVESEPHRGTRVREICDREMSESTIVRGILEEAAARTAANHIRGRIADLRAETKGMFDALETHKLDEFARHFVNFHRIIVQACGNTVLIETWDSLAFEEKSRLCARKAAHSMMLQGVKHHESIIEAFEAGDGERAGRLLREHTERCGALQATASVRMSADEFQKALAQEIARQPVAVQ
jgi:DNA-binding GntR family transcriptional regulator